MDNPCFKGAVASREAEQLGNGSGNRWGREISREHEQVLCLFLAHASAQQEPLWPVLPRTGLGAQPGVSLCWTGKDDQAWFSNCPLQHFQFYQMDFISSSSLMMSERGGQVYSSIFDN